MHTISCHCCGEETPQETAEMFKGKVRCPSCVRAGVLPPKQAANWGGAIVYLLGGVALTGAGLGLTLMSGGNTVFYGLIGAGVLGMGYAVYEIFEE